MFDTQKLLYREVVAQRTFYTEGLSHAEVFRQGSFYSEELLNTGLFAHRISYTGTLFHTEAIHKQDVTQRSFYAENLCHKGPL